MKHRYQIPMFSFYDHTGMTCHLEKMARRGWMIDKMSNFLWRYKAIEPQRMRFAMVYFPEVTGFEPGKPEGHQKMEELCAGTGWRLAATAGKFQAYYNEDPDPVELETDPGVQVEVIHRAMKKSLIPAYILLMVAAVMNIIVQFGMLRPGYTLSYSGPVYYFSSVSWMMLPCWAALMSIYLLELTRYFLWYRKAVRRAEDGLHTPTGGSFWTQAAALSLLTVLVLSWLATSQLSNIVLPVFITMFVAAALSVLASRIMRSLGVRATINRIVTMGVAMVLTFGLVHGTTYSILMRNRQKEEQNEDIPLRLEDLGWPADSDSILRDEQHSPLITRLHCRQRPGWHDADRPDLEYIVADIHFRPLLQPCLENFLGEEPQALDATPWQADTAWRVKTSFYAGPCYVLCWGNRLVWLRLESEPTPVQMTAVADALRP